MSVTVLNKIENGDWPTTEFDIISIDGQFELSDLSAIVAKRLPVTNCVFPNQTYVNKYPYLTNVHFHEPTNKKISMIIGTDEPRLWAVKESRYGRGRRDPVAQLGPLGWVLIGSRNSRSNQSSFIQIDYADIKTRLNRMYVMDFGDINPDKIGQSLDDQRALKVWRDSCKLITFQGEPHYQLALPYAQGERENVKLPPLEKVDKMARKRMAGLGRRLAKNPDLFEQTCEHMDKNKRNGVVRVLPPDEQRAPQGCPEWRLPLTLAIHPRKGKVRVCYDAAATVDGVSMNSELLSGPDLMNSLFGVLLRFRQEFVTIQGDLEGMFDQVRLDPKDCWMKCFYFWKNNDLSQDLELNQLMTQMFGSKPSPGACNFALKQTAHDNEHLYPEEIIFAIIWSFYMDDHLSSHPDPATAIRIITKLMELCRKGGFRLCKISSNHPEVLKAIPESERAVEPDQTFIEHSLGVKFDLQSDQFFFSLTHLQDRPNPTTPRQCLSILSSPFDPLCLIHPCSLKARKSLQLILAKGYGWDEKIEEKLLTVIWAWKDKLHFIDSLRFSRCFKKDFGAEPLQIDSHNFVDASELGLGCCSYLRFTYPNGFHVVFVAAKSLVTPFKPQTMPRLELTSARTGVRLWNQIKSELTYQISTVAFWTDSTSTLRKINNTARRFKIFDQNRLNELAESTNPSQWEFVRSELNPADLASRGFEADDQNAIHFFHHGPEFLSQSEDKWPIENWSRNLTEEDLKDVKDDKELASISVTPNKKSRNKVPPKGNFLIDKLMRSMSHTVYSWDHLIDHMVWLNRFAISRKSRSPMIKTAINVKEFRLATNDVIKWIQKKYFGELIDFFVTEFTQSSP